MKPSKYSYNWPEISVTRLIHFKSNWQVMTEYPWAIQSIVGYKIPSSSPRQWRPVETFTEGDLANSQMMEVIQSLIDKGVAKEVEFHPDEFLAGVFLIKKRMAVKSFDQS